MIFLSASTRKLNKIVSELVFNVEFDDMRRADELTSHLVQ